MAFLEQTEARLEEEEPASVDTTPEVADDQEVPVEDAEVRSVTEPRKRRRDGRNLAAVRRQKKQNRDLDARRRGRQQDLVVARRGTTRRAVVARRRMLLTKETRGYCGSQKRVIAVYRKMPRHTTVAWRRRHTRKNLQSRQESGKATKDLGGNRPLYPEKRKTTGIDTGGWSLGRLSPLGRRGPTYNILKMALELELAKQAKGTPSGLRTSKQWTLSRDRPPPKRKK
jgi:hypothetical protein